jgi:hypothetical protein
LREIVDEPTIGLNFRRDTFATGDDRRSARRLATPRRPCRRRAAALRALQGVSYYELSSQYDELRTVVQKAFHTVLPGMPVVDEAEQLARNQEATEAAAATRLRAEWPHLTPGGPSPLPSVLH